MEEAEKTRKTEKTPFRRSIQLKFALSYIVIIAAVLALYCALLLLLAACKQGGEAGQSLSLIHI